MPTNPLTRTTYRAQRKKKRNSLTKLLADTFTRGLPNNKLGTLIPFLGRGKCRCTAFLAPQMERIPSCSILGKDHRLFTDFARRLPGQINTLI